MVEFSKFVASQRGGLLLVDKDGFIYSKKKTSQNFTVYLCKENKRTKKDVEHILKCPAKLKFYSEEELFLDPQHNHEPQLQQGTCIEL